MPKNKKNTPEDIKIKDKATLVNKYLNAIFIVSIILQHILWQKYFDSKVENPGVNESVDDNIISYAKMLPSLVENKMNGLKVNEALEDIFELLKRSNKYIDDTTPWILAKDEANNDRLKTVLYNLLESIRISAVLLRAFIPDTSEKIFKMLTKL